MYELLKTILIEDLKLDPAKCPRTRAAKSRPGLARRRRVVHGPQHRRLDIDISDDELLELKTLAAIVQLIEQRTAGVR